MTEKWKTVRDIQRIELDILKVFQRICGQYNLRYFAVGGTCIGAVRHKGFIPWDDDIDIAMPYADYIRFIEIAPQELPADYKLYLPEENRHWDHNFIKIQDVRTTFIEKNCLEYEDRYTGVYIDIMPIYGMPETRFFQSINAVWCDLMLYLNRRQRFSFRQQPSAGSRFIWLLNSLNYHARSYNYYNRKLHRHFSKYGFERSDRVLFGWRRRPSRFRPLYKYKSVFEYKDFSDYIEMPFEDTVIRVPAGYDHYLKMDFGDYMRLPPEEQREPRHEVDIMDLDKPCAFYKEERF